MNLPQKLPETGDYRNKVLYGVINQMIDYMRSITLQPAGSSGKLQRNPSGTTLIPTPAPPGGISLIMGVVTAHYSFYDPDYIGVTKFDLANMKLVGDEMATSKAITSRQPASELIDGNIITYQYNLVGYSNDVRLATYPDGSTTYQSVLPAYNPWLNPEAGYFGVPDGGDISQYLTFITQADTGQNDVNGNPIKYLEIMPQRFWTASVPLNYVL